MDPIQLLLVALLVAILGALVYVFFLKKEEKKEILPDQNIAILQREIHNLQQTMNARLGEGNQMAMNQSSEAQRLIRELNRDVHEQIAQVREGVAKVSESSNQIFTIGESLRDLEKVLKHQKQRGNLGEASLQLALENVLPPDGYELQYQFPGGETVDAVIKAKEGLIPVDAKFSLDNYTRFINENDEIRKGELEKEFTNDLKKRIDETAKYIRPKDGTLPFAFMYIPAEAIYYDLLVNEVGSVKSNTRSLIDYAYKDKNVVIVSPTTFTAYLQSVIYGFRAFQIEKRTQVIQKNVEQLTRHLAAYDEYYRKLGNSLNTTVNHYTAGYKEFAKIDKDILKITDTSIGIEPLVLEKPTSGNDD